MLREVDIAPDEVRISEETVKILRKALERAEKGELREVVVVATEAEADATWYAYTGTLGASQRVGMLEWVKAVFMRDWLADEDERG